MIESEVNIIAAVSDNGVIGKDNTIPWKQKSDMSNFKSVTLNNVIVMGSRTFDSLNRKPLSNRINFVVSRNIGRYSTISSEWPVAFISTLEDALMYADRAAKHEGLKIFIIGGESIYKQTINQPYVKKLLITKIHANIDGDTYFPPIDETWRLMSVVNFLPDEDNQYPYSFYRFER